MQWIYNYTLSFIIFLPFISAVLSCFIRSLKLAKTMHLIISNVVFIASLYTWFNFDTSTSNLQFHEEYSWIPSLGIKYVVGLDGLNILLVILTTFLVPVPP